MCYKILQTAIEANTAAIQSLENTIRVESQITQDLIEEGNAIRSFQVDRLKQIQTNIKLFQAR